jgi:drug/metabolite transporter (DMT)-like permease
MRTIALGLGLAFLALAGVYWVVPAGSLPSFVPGFEAGVPRTHPKHGIAAAVVALVLFGFGWYAGRSRA